MRKKAIALYALFLPAVASAQYVADPAGVRELKIIVADDYRTALEGGKSAFDWGIPQYTEKLSAHDLSMAYQRDRDGTTTRLKGQWLAVGGAVDQIGVDPDGKPFVEFAATSDSYQNVHARFDTAYDFIRGDVDWVICKNAGVKGGSPQLQHCIFKYPTNNTRYVPRDIDQSINAWFASGHVPPYASDPRDRGRLFLMYWSGLHALKSGSCGADGISQQCESEIMSYAKLAAQGNWQPFLHDYAEARASLSLPVLKFQAVTK